MKYIMAIFFIAFSFVANSQVIQEQNGNYAMQRVITKNGFRLPIVDSLPASPNLRNYTGDSATGALVFNKSDSAIYYWVYDEWRKITDFGSDTSAFSPVIDTTGIEFQRVVVAGADGKLKGYVNFLYDSALARLTITRTAAFWSWADPSIVTYNPIYSTGLANFQRAELWDRVSLPSVATNPTWDGDTTDTWMVMADRVNGDLYTLRSWDWLNNLNQKIDSVTYDGDSIRNWRNGTNFLSYEIAGGSSGSSQWRDTTNGIYYNEGNVGIGSKNPEHRFHLSKPILPASGGTITFDGDSAIHIFRATDTLYVTDSIAVRYLLVAGGGGAIIGGGGAGGMLEGDTILAPGSYAVVVGAGGTPGNKGGNSTFYGLQADGGGAGRPNDATNVNGGSGGAGSTAGTGIAGQGNNAGQNSVAGGGGGGAGTAGQNGSSAAGGNAGDGRISNITGVNLYYAGGGGGGFNSAVFGVNGRGGLGGGGNGGQGINATDGVPNTGGGGGGTNSSFGGITRRGGSGIVVIKYASSNTDARTEGFLRADNIQIVNQPFTNDTINVKPIVSDSLGNLYRLNNYVYQNLDSIAIIFRGSQLQHLVSRNTNTDGGSSLIGQVFIGAAAGQSMTSGSENTAVGNSALASNTTGIRSAAFGHSALSSATGSSNTAIGYIAGSVNTTGIRNFYGGAGAGSGNTTGSDNVFIGTGNRGNANSRVLIGASFVNSTVGNSTIIIGSHSLVPTGINNIFFGNDVANQWNSGSNATDQIIMGYWAGRRLTGNGNIAIGRDAGTGGINNGGTTNNGLYNIFLGYQTGRNTVSSQTGNDNILIGRDIGKPDLSGSNQLSIGGNGINWITKFTGNQFLINASGAAVTTPTTSAALEINGTTGALLLPRLTTTERNALTASNGMIIYNTTDNKFQGYAGGAWVDLH